MAPEYSSSIPAPPKALVRAIALFNTQQFYACHEVLEDDLWRHETNAVLKQCYQGILQVAVGYHHAQHGNAIGMRNLLAKGHAKLQPLCTTSPIAHWVDLLPLLGVVAQHRKLAETWVASHVPPAQWAKEQCLLWPTLRSASKGRAE